MFSLALWHAAQEIFACGRAGLVCWSPLELEWVHRQQDKLETNYQRGAEVGTGPERSAVGISDY